MSPAEDAAAQTNNAVRMEVDMSDDTNLSPPDSDASFLGWQETGSGKAFALHVVTAPNHPLRGSTVSEKSLLKLDLQVPPPQQPPGISFRRKGESRKGNTP